MSNGRTIPCLRATRTGSNFAGSEQFSRCTDNLERLHQARVVISIIAQVFAVEARLICSPLRESARIAFARQVAMYLTHIRCGLNYTETGQLFNRDRTTVAYACALIEDQRDDPILDQTLTHTELAARRLIHSTQKESFPI